ncbi:MarR family winged helix-turn-helix transcriptional regulator [Pseudomonas sp. 5P_3.1_Bac2]|uniref:MarR family winged helix-turn-helix transcriptional regulator n=1 Tax=Pseudomonas sp. 5P_3.1_Bac2 TaxID=2971617 RepID=UPI0021C7F86A|nr:MarR family transcriptional regulator [Pseudomonas sp. 5P_3.1_Bac2]MCU1716634.1 MarR family transcriptional regulator [Pseudomonas sp. 5P_3.1_Bac2]
MTDRAENAVNQWAQEKPQLPGLPMLLVGRLGEVVNVISHTHLNPLFNRFGLQPGEFDVLATLRRSGQPYALTPTALYEATMVSSGGMTNRIDRLEKDGWVERQKNPHDRRGTLVYLTAAGLALIDELIELHVANEQQMLAALSEQEQEQLSQLLAKLLASL